jgi:hypothetical protein
MVLCNDRFIYDQPEGGIGKKLSWLMKMRLVRPKNNRFIVRITTLSDDDWFITNLMRNLNVWKLLWSTLNPKVHRHHKTVLLTVVLRSYSFSCSCNYWVACVNVVDNGTASHQTNTWLGRNFNGYRKLETEKAKNPKKKSIPIRYHTVVWDN